MWQTHNKRGQQVGDGVGRDPHAHEAHVVVAARVGGGYLGGEEGSVAGQPVVCGQVVVSSGAGGEARKQTSVETCENRILYFEV